MTDKNYSKQNIENRISDRLNQNIELQITEAIKVVSEIENVDSKKAYLKIQDRLQNKSNILLIINTLSRVAAVLFLPLLVATGVLLYHPFSLKEKPQFAIQEISSPAGVRSQVVLPDGSNVWLNAESTIKFRVPFDKASREVSLSGEAFFDVRKNPNFPFVVKSGKVNISVLGTRFNCRAYETEKNMEVVLAEGKIRLDNTAGQTGKEFFMKPNDRVVIDKASYNVTSITNEKIDKYIAWHNGKLVFDDTLMPEVAAQIGRFYGVEVRIEDSILNSYRITTTFENESLHQVLELIRLSSPIKIQYINATLDKTNQRQTRSKVIFSKKTKK